MLSTGAIVPEVRVGREWELEGKLGYNVNRHSLQIGFYPESGYPGWGL